MVSSCSFAYNSVLRRIYKYNIKKTLYIFMKKYKTVPFKMFKGVKIRGLYMYQGVHVQWKRSWRNCATSAIPTPWEKKKTNTTHR